MTPIENGGHVRLSERLAGARAIDLEQPRFAGMPGHPAHRPAYFYALYRRHRDYFRPAGGARRTSASGVLTMMEHSGTHIDALCHQAYDQNLHGGLPVVDVERPDGFRALGVETVAPLIGRGVLLDVAGWKGVARLAPDSSIPGADLAACAEATGVDVRPGDVLLVRTGFGACWADDEAYQHAAGVSRSGSEWAADRGVVAVGADNMAWDAVGDRDPETGLMLFAHAFLLVDKGIYILENLNLETLAASGHRSFAFVGIPLKLRGATGSPIRPLALVEPGIGAEGE
jgi:kynurenine formamidase